VRLAWLNFSDTFQALIQFADAVSAYNAKTVSNHRNSKICTVLDASALSVLFPAYFYFTMTLDFDLLTSKFEALIPVPKWISALTMFRTDARTDGRTVGRTNRQENNASGHTTWGRGIKILAVSSCS